ncbi:hypothetical protein ACFE04_019750 [Oxalis oulophora]
MDYTLKDYTPISLTFGHGNLLPENAHQIHCEMFSEVKCPQKVAKVRFYKMNNFFMSPYHKRDASQVEFKLGSRITDESWNDLNKFMGSKKIKSRQMAAERNSANLSDLNKTVTEAAGNNQSTTESPVSSSPGPGIDYLPPCDRSTNDITQAYKMNDLVSPDILDSLHSIAEEVLNMDLILLASDSSAEVHRHHEVNCELPGELVNHSVREFFKILCTLMSQVWMAVLERAAT